MRWLLAAALCAVAHAQSHAPAPRMRIKAPILTDIYPKAGDARGNTVITLGGHAFNDTRSIQVSPLQHMSNGPKWGLQCQFMMSPPVWVPALFVDGSTIKCMAPKHNPNDDDKAPLPIDPTATKIPIRNEVQVRVTHDGLTWSNAMKYYYGVADCCTPHASAGCMNPTIRECVCKGDPVCCMEGRLWDAMCVQNVRTLGCETDANQCPSDSVANLNTKFASIHLPPQKRTSWQKKLDQSISDPPLEIPPQNISSVKSKSPHNGPTDSEVFEPYSDMKHVMATLTNGSPKRR